MGVGRGGVTIVKLLVAMAVASIVAACASQEPGGDPPASSQQQLEVTSIATPTPVASSERLIFTYYFYWYDAATGAHLKDSVLQHRPPQQPAPSWHNVAWHKKELADMDWAGIDVVLPVYWGSHKPEDRWSWMGLTHLAQAWTELREAGQSPPKIGMFFDTTIIDHRDLTAPEGKAYFYGNIKDFFDRIPREQWAEVEGRPVVFLFTSDWTAAFNQSTFDYVYDQFTKDFGVRPYIVREVSWDFPILRWVDGEREWDEKNPIHTDNSYLWDAANHGYIDRGGVAAIGPGYDDRGVPGRGQGRFRQREDGQYYRKAFKEAIASGKPLLVIETWNEFHEGSGISETVEFGRRYLELTRELAAEFHKHTP